MKYSCSKFIILVFILIISSCGKPKLKTAAVITPNPSTVPLHIWSLPKPDLKLIPDVPPGWNTHPGGNGFPVWKEENDAGAPVIGFQTDTTFSNETIALMGDKLNGADFVLWAEGLTLPVSALRTDVDRAQIIVPADSSKPVPKSVMFLWPHNSSGYGTPVRLNAPVLFWVWPGKKWTNEPDIPIRIFGKNLFLSTATNPLVVVQRGSDVPISLQVSYKTANEVRANLPQGYLSGDYKVWIHNGTGGSYGWSEAGSFSVSTNSYNTSKEFKVDLEEGTDLQKIIEAVRKANANGGGTVVFSGRTYTLTEDVNIPVTSAPPAVGTPILLKGTGSGVGGTLLTAHGTLANPERSLNLKGAGSGVEDMKLVGVRISVNNQDIHIHNVDASMNNHPISIYEDYMVGRVHPRQKLNLNVTHSTFRAVNAGAYVGWASYIRFDNCHFFGRYYDGAYNEMGIKFAENNLDNQGISFRNTHNVIVENSNFQSEAPLNGKILTRAIAVLYSTDSHHVYSNNTMNWIGAFPSAYKPDRNSGEIILFHGAAAGLMSTVESADWESVTVNRPVSDFNEYDFQTHTNKREIELDLLKVYVLSGPAAGQVRSLKSVNSNGSGKALLKVPRWQHVLPRVGDKIVVRSMFYQNLILNNKIDAVPEPSRVNINFSRVGIMFWSPSHDSVISGNIIKHQSAGIHIQAGSGGIGAQGSNYIRGNTITDSIKGGPYNTYSICYEEVGGGKFIPGRQIHSLGNVFRDNTCSGAEAGVAIGAFGHDRIGISYGRNDNLYEKSPYTGITHSIIENNSITGISGTASRPNLGFAISTSANWTLLRNNTMDRKSNIDFYLPNLIHQLLHIEK